MEALRLILRYVHLIGFALLLGSFVVQYFSGKFRVNTVMVSGAAIQLVTGLALAAPLGREVHPDPAKLAIKGLFALLIFIMVWTVRRRDAVARGHFLAIGLLTLANAAVATFWR